MKFSDFGKKFTGCVGICDLMDDMGKALAEGNKIMLGGGNPAHIPEVNSLWRSRMDLIMENGCDFEKMVANYESPQGNPDFLNAMAALLTEEYGWDVTRENIAVVNSSQNAFFLLFNMFCGAAGGVMRKILFPQMPEYIGYADQAIEDGCYVGNPSRITEIAPNSFKYAVDFDRLHITPDIGAMCVSRPTNPTGNVLTDGEIARLASMAEDADIPLLIDNAYGLPFPDILFTDKAQSWIRETFPRNADYAVHVSEGALFLWIWFKNLSIPARELYNRLKGRGVVVVPGEYFFFGLAEPWDHAQRCIRLTYSQADDDVKRGIEIIAAEVAGLV